MSEQQINLTQLQDTFQLFDKNNDGRISSSEVCRFFSIIIKNLFFFSFLNLIASISMSKITNAN